MKDTRLLGIFLNVKETLCKYDYYIHTSKRIIHLTNSEDKIPHLMGLQYAGRPNQYTGDYGAYSIKKGRITMQSIEKLVDKYYKTEEKRRRILEVIHLKLDNLQFLPEMFHSYSRLYLYDVRNEDSEFDSDYLMVHELEDRILHLGIIKAGVREKNLCQCNSFLTTYKKDKNSDSFYCNLEHCYEINKIVRENKESKKAEVIYQSEEAVLRETAGIEKMLSGTGIETDEKLIKVIVKLNVKFGKYHTLEMLSDSKQLLEQCCDKREEELVNIFWQLWTQKTNSK